ncbi:Nodulation protein G [Fusarium oxysporum f. sp. albedinis]|nr:Nodulation protein G [Fusarium oxysporum f. sp. albedinis]
MPLPRAYVLELSTYSARIRRTDTPLLLQDSRQNSWLLRMPGRVRRKEDLSATFTPCTHNFSLQLSKPVLFNNKSHPPTRSFRSSEKPKLNIDRAGMVNC